MTTLLIATRNAHKVAEIRAILGAQFRYLTLTDFPGAPAVVEDAETFEGNAAKKAASLAEWLAQGAAGNPIPGGRLLVLADDSGLEVDALHGAPGVHSARFAALDGAGPPAGNSPDADNNAKLLRLLRDVPQELRAARFRCVIAVVEALPAAARPAPRCCSGACEGRIDFAPRGAGGFGYDPLFIPAGREESFAELGEEVKNALSHRARALAQVRAWLR